MKYTKIYLGVILTLVMVGLVVAQDVAEQYPSSLEIFFNNIKHTFNIGQFSVVGDNKVCGTSGGNPNKEWRNLQSGEDFISTASSECSSGTGLYDVFTNGWTPFKEYKDFVHIQCATPPCNVQLYCCPELTCSNPTTVSCSQWSGKPSGFYKCPNENQIPYDKSSYEYCPIVTTMTCYYRDGNNCGSRTYSKSLFPNSCEDYTYEDRKLYSSKSTCEGRLGECIVDLECPSTNPICEEGVCVEEEEPEPPEEPPEDDTCLANGEINIPLGKDCCSGCQSAGVCEACDGEIPPDGDEDEDEIPPTAEQPPECISEQGIFYTDGYAIIGKGNFKFLGYASETTSGDVGVINTKDLQGIIPGLSAKYYENRAITCCDDLKALYEDEKIFQYSKTDFNLLKVFGQGYLDKVLGWFGMEEDDIERISVTYSIYKCVPEEEVGFCLEFTHRWLNKYTKTDDCQTNTIIFIVLTVAGFIVISRFAG